MSMITKDLGAVSAYAYAVEQGYTGTEAEFAELMASYADVAQQAGESAQTATEKAQQASASATSASQSADTASASATSAQTAQQTATAKASEAQQGATTATTKAQEASQSASTASQKAQEASQSASDAESAKTASETAQASAESARDDAESARDAAQQYAESIDPEKLIGAYPVDTATGAIASFSDGADNIPMKDVLVHIEPVQKGSGDPSPDNVRPISGWTGAKVTRAGKNLLPYPYSSNSGTYNGVIFTKYEDGTVNCSGTATGTAFFNLKSAAESFLLKAGTYVISGAISGSIIVIGDTATNLPVGSTSNNNGNFTLAKDTEASAYIRVNPGNSVNGIAKPMIRLATESDAEYEPYQGEIYDITFPTEAGTVYGGTLDVTKGEFVVDRVVLTYNTANMSNSEDYPGWKDAKVADIAGAGTNTTMPEVVTNVGIGVGVNTVAIPGVIFLPKQLHNNLTQSDWKALALDVQIVLPLASPIHYPLTPTEIKTLLGQNNLWADTGDTEVEYRADTKLYIEKLTQPEEYDMIADSAINSGQFFMVGNSLYRALANIASGATITVGTNAERVSLSDALNLVNA